MGNILTQNLINIPGWHTNRHLVVIESDDWGSVRMPSREVYNQFLKEGIRVDKDVYCRYDSLANKQDLEVLFDALTSVRDKNNNHAVITANSVVANPDFKKIADSNFKQYYYEPFTKTLESTGQHDGVFNLWQEGISNNIFHPQFHGREHVNIKKWLDILRKGDDKITRRAFELGTFGLTANVSKNIPYNYMSEFRSCEKSDIEAYVVSLKEGLELFYKLFGYKSKSFIAPTYTWSQILEPYLLDLGIKYIQGVVVQQIPKEDGTLRYKRTNFQGRRNKLGQIYLMRNCFFEPSQTRDHLDAVDDCLNRIKIAFRWGKAAVISSHRLNYIGNIDVTNRNINIVLFKSLLKEIVNKWPDVEFVSSDTLGDIISNKVSKLRM